MRSLWLVAGRWPRWVTVCQRLFFVREPPDTVCACAAACAQQGDKAYVRRTHSQHPASADFPEDVSALTDGRVGLGFKHLLGHTLQYSTLLHWNASSC